MISFELTKEQKELRDSTREFAEKEIRPKMKQMFEAQSFDPELVDKMKKRFVKMWFPKEYGGSGSSTLDICIVMEEIAYIHSTSILIMEGGGLGGSVILNGGTEEQKKKYLPPLTKGDAWYAFGMTDEGPGSDAAGMASTATKTKGGYLLNGMKRLISNCDIATAIIVFAKTDPTKGAKGISAFVVDKKSEGLTMKRLFGWGGIEHKVYELHFKDCFVPAENLIGKENEGFITSMKTLDRTRIGLAAANVGKARAALDMAVDYAKKRVVFGKPIKDYQAIAFPVADLAAQMEAGRLMTYYAAWLTDMGLKHTKETSMCKLICVETAALAAEHLIKVLGGYGWSKDYPAGKMFVDAKMAQYGQGSLEIQKLIIARELFGK